MRDRLPIEGDLRLSSGPIRVGDLVKRRLLHQEYGGSPQSGICPLRRFLAVFAFTGSSGTALGYEDEWRPDGSFRFYGEGQHGDMRDRAGNKAINEHEADGARLFLFRMGVGSPGNVRFLGEFRRIRRGEDRGPDRDAVERRRFYFDLDEVGAHQSSESRDTQETFDEGREREIRTNVVERNRKAVQAAKRIHGLDCQVCGFNFGRFYGDHGSGFVEVHHIVPVAQAARKKNGQVNARTEMVVVCANCHRMLHRGRRLVSIDELRNRVEDARQASDRRSPS